MLVEVKGSDVICCHGFHRGGTVGVVVCVFVLQCLPFMLMSPDKSNTSDEPFLTIVALVVLTILNRLMNKDPLGGKSTIEHMFPSYGGLLLD